MPKMNLTEATILALQGKLNLEESIDISIQDDSTMIDTDESTVIIQNKEELEDVEETECEDCEEPEVVEVPVEGEETIIPEQEIPEEQVEEITSEEVPTVEEIADGETDLDESKQLDEERLGNNTFTDKDEAEYYRNKELYHQSGLERHKKAMDKAKEACKNKGIKVDETEGVYESCNKGLKENKNTEDTVDISQEFFGHSLEDDIDEYEGPVPFDRFLQRAIDFGVEDEAFEKYGNRSRTSVNKIVREYYKDYKAKMNRAIKNTNLKENKLEKQMIDEAETQGVYESKKIKTEDTDEGSDNEQEDTQEHKLTPDMTDEEIVDYIVNNYKDITGEEVDSVFADGTNATEDSPIFNQEAIDEVSDKILAVLDEADITGKRLEDILYALDDKLAMMKTGEVEEEPEPEFAESEPELDESKEIKTEGNIFADGSDIVSNLIDRACNELEGDELADFLQGIIGQIREVAEEKDLFVESKEEKDESKDCKEEKEPVKEGFSKQSFNEVFTKYYKDTISKTESFETIKVLKNDKSIKVEGKLNLTNGNSKDITLTLNKVQEGTSFTKYELHESGLLKESKSSVAKLMTRTNDNVIKCCYITK